MPTVDRKLQGRERGRKKGRKRRTGVGEDMIEKEGIGKRMRNGIKVCMLK